MKNTRNFFPQQNDEELDAASSMSSVERDGGKFFPVIMENDDASNASDVVPQVVPQVIDPIKNPSTQPETTIVQDIDDDSEEEKVPELTFQLKMPKRVVRKIKSEMTQM